MCSERCFVDIITSFILSTGIFLFFSIVSNYIECLAEDQSIQNLILISLPVTLAYLLQTLRSSIRYGTINGIVIYNAKQS